VVALAPVLLVLMLLGCSGTFEVSPAQDVRPGGSSQPAPAGQGQARALGRLEPASGLIVVGARPGARVEKIDVQEGDEVPEGKVLAVLEGHGQADRQLALAKAQKDRAEHELSLRRKKLTLEREQFDATQKARIEAAKKVAAATKQRFDQASPLYKTFVATLKDKERYDAEMAFLQLEVQSIRSALDLSLLETAQEMTPKQRALEDEELDKTGPDFQVLDRQIELAQAGLDQAEVKAPAAGKVLELRAHAGEVSTGALLTLGDTSAMVAIAEVFQTDAPRVTVGDPAEVRILDRTVSGRVTAIGSVVGRNQVTSLDPRALQDRRVVNVTVRLDDPAPAARFVNMEVDVLIKPSGPGARADGR
jgi:HlyD family secretion protein